MAYIYKVTNKLNGKIYIGKTLFSIEERWKQHCRDSRKELKERRPLYSAIRKYGEENFSIEQIEECSDSVVNERETYWIEWYGSFKCGYNATLGGDGKHYLDYDLICETYNQVQNTVKTAEICGCCVDSVRNILRERHIPTLSSQEISKTQLSKMVNQYSLKEDYIRTFSSITDAAKYIQSLNPEKRTQLAGIRQHISDAAKGKRKIAYKYIWKYSD